jgi:large subunit ribosomal protein L19e
MVSLKLQKRLAAAVLGCGKRKVWLDPNESTTLGNAKTRRSIRRLVRDNLVRKLPNTVHTRVRAHQRYLAKRKGRHMGLGSRKGTKEARFPTKIMWMRRMRVLRSFLRKYRAQSKIDKHLYSELYTKSKGGAFKNKRTLMEHIHVAQDEKKRELVLAAEAAARRAKVRAKKEKMANAVY